MTEEQQMIYNWLHAEDAWRELKDIWVLDQFDRDHEEQINELVAMGAALSENNGGVMRYTWNPRFVPPPPELGDE